MTRKNATAAAATLTVLAGCASTPAPVLATRPPDAVAVALPVESGQSVPAKVTVTRVAHATVLVDFDGETVLTDPWFTETSQYHQGEPLGVALGQLPKLAAVVVSHGHYDHFDIDAFAEYPDKSVPFFVVPGLADAARKAGFTNVRELVPWESARAGSLTITAAPGEHAVPEITFVIQGKGDTVYFGGDTKLVPALGELSTRFPHIDLALLAVNGLHAMGRQVVMTDEEAARFAGRLNASVAVPIHYAFKGGWLTDTFVLSYHGSAEGFAQAAKTAAPHTQVRILEPGERLDIVHVPTSALAQPLHAQASASAPLAP
jgi:L-ascorbate metabolism protein UlaG (beta-lactamase superfamily)